MSAIPHPRSLTPVRITATTPDRVDWSTPAGSLTVEAYAPGIFRLRLGRSQSPDYGLLVQPSAAPVVQTTRHGSTTRLEMEGGLALEVEADPFRIRLFMDRRLVLQSVTDGHIRGGLRLQPLLTGPGWTGLALALEASEPVYGLGEKFDQLNRRGQIIDSWNEDALGVNSEYAYKNTPFAWSPQGWGLLVHTPSRTVHGVGYGPWSHRSYVVLAEDDHLDIFLFAGSPQQILERYTWLTGRTPLLPRWSYGVWWSRCYYRTADELLEAAHGLRQRKIPAELIKLDGRAWLKVETRCALEFDPERYPDPAAFMAQIKALDLKMCVWEYPFIAVANPIYADLAQKGYFLKDAQGQPYVFHWDPEPFGQLLTPLPPSGLLDFTNPAAYRWWQERHQALWDLGVDVIKPDFGEQIPREVVAHNGDTGARLHNVYALLYNQAVFEATPERLVFARSSYTGSQRYPVQWGGDPQADWEGLAASIRGGLSWGLSGAAHQTHDIGGFYGPAPSPELYVRWAQAGIHTSHTRFHGTSPREPWYFGEEVTEVVTRWLYWRMRLIPYLETMAQQAHQTGIPLARAMVLAFPDQPLSWSFEHQYLLGDALLVAPVIRPGGNVKVYLPAGGWYDLWTGERLEGGRLLNLQVPLDRMPIFGREGTALPLGPAVEHTGQIAAGDEIEQVWLFGPSAQSLWPHRPAHRWDGTQRFELFLR